VNILILISRFGSERAAVPGRIFQPRSLHHFAGRFGCCTLATTTAGGLDRHNGGLVGRTNLSLPHIDISLWPTPIFWTWSTCAQAVTLGAICFLARYQRVLPFSQSDEGRVGQNSL
jgi:hypothetical protein